MVRNEKYVLYFSSWGLQMFTNISFPLNFECVNLKEKTKEKQKQKERNKRGAKQRLCSFHCWIWEVQNARHPNIGNFMFQSENFNMVKTY